MLKFLILILSLCVQSNVLAQTNYWICTATDTHQKQWQYTNIYQRMAMTKALQACKQQSESPRTCLADEDHCDFFLRGKSTKPLWRCTALDEKAQSFQSAPYFQQDDAAIAAKKRCQQNSRSPDIPIANGVANLAHI